MILRPARSCTEKLTPQSAFTPEAFTTLPQASLSDQIWRANSSWLEGDGVRPSVKIAYCTSAVLSALPRSALN